MEAEEGIQNEPEVTDDTTTDSGGGVNYHDRIRSEAEFAVEEVQKKDRYIGELHEKQAKYKGLDQYIDALGSSDALVEMAALGHRIETNPELKQALQDAMNGTSKPTTLVAEEEEEIYDPEIKSMRDTVRRELNARDEVIRDLQARLDKTEAVTLKGSLEENMEKALSTFSDDSESLAEATQEIQKAVDQLERQAKSGDRSAAQQLESLGGPMGDRTLKMMTVDIRDNYFTKKLSGSSNRPNGENMRSKATDGRAKTHSPPPTNEVVVKPGFKVNTQSVVSVMNQVASKLGKDLNSTFG